MQQKKPTFFKDKNGKVVLWQFPNPLLFAWAFLVLATVVIHNPSFIKLGLEHLASAILFVWAYQETTTGVNYFRKTLGIVVLAYVIYGFFA